MKNFLLIIVLLLSACSSQDDINNAKQELPRKEVESTQSYLRIIQGDRLDYIDFAVPLNEQSDFSSGKGEVNLYVNKDVYLSFSTKKNSWYLNEEHRNWSFDQSKYIYIYSTVPLKNTHLRSRSSLLKQF